MPSKDSYKNHVYALILAGGGGTRLWPRSRNKTPKQFLKLFKGETLAQITLYRFSKMLPWERIYCVTVSEDYKREILKEVPEFVAENIIVEPARRDTAPAHGLGALYIYKRDPNAVIITEAADRLVNPVSKYLSTLEASAKVAHESGVLVSVGVKPRYPHTGLGHIKRGKKYEVGSSKHLFYKADRFVEKPPLALAKRFTASGKYYWNAGQFVWRADGILGAIEKYAPKIKNSLDAILEAWNTPERKDDRGVINKEYKAMPTISIDFAVVEKVKNMVVTSGDFFWTDIGDWNEVWKNLGKDEAGNVIIDGNEPGGEIMNIDTSNSLIHKDGRLIAVVGVDNVVIVDTKDALLIISKSKAQNVKKIVNQLKEENKVKYL